MPRDAILLATCVWGDWHRNVMLRAMWPTLLQDRNLPALAARKSVEYLITTTAADYAALRLEPTLASLQRIVPVSFEIVEDTPDIQYHLDWYHQTIRAALDRGSYFALVPPDVAWSNGTFGHLAGVMDAGKAVAVPFLRVLDQLDGFYPPETPGALVRFVLDNLHPLARASFIGNPDGRLSLDAMWPVADEGILLHHMARELFAFDPAKILPTDLIYAGNGTIADHHIVTDSDDMFMASFAPAEKDITTGVFTPGRPVTPRSVAEMSLHPLNDNPLVEEFVHRAVRIHAGAMTETLWQEAEAYGREFVAAALAERADMQREALVVTEDLQQEEQSDAA